MPITVWLSLEASAAHCLAPEVAGRSYHMLCVCVSLGVVGSNSYTFLVATVILFEALKCYRAHTSLVIVQHLCHMFSFCLLYCNYFLLNVFPIAATL